MSADILQMSVYEPERRPRRIEFHENGDLFLARRRLGAQFCETVEGGSVFVSLDVEGSDEVLVNVATGIGYPIVQTIDDAIATLSLVRDNLASRA